MTNQRSTSTPAAPGQARYWRVHFRTDPFDHWVSIDCGQRVSESRAVALAERAWPDRGRVTSAIQDAERIRGESVGAID